jgi:hypothetical protein
MCHLLYLMGNYVYSEFKDTLHFRIEEVYIYWHIHQCSSIVLLLQRANFYSLHFKL